ncbi:tRNA adenosine(34) deaminase TadA [Negativibacillus massiliensis]|uniref:tRNA adenosine(34) deaminase TadA n=1 Tax=Negativibacillus massiliensis TaxID=1871035 RepID=UPI003AF64594
MQQSIPSYQQRDAHWMHQALLEAKKAAALGEIPVGAVIVRDEQVIARAHNRRELDQDAMAHAEVLCIQQACRVLNSWRLSGCTLYVTLEPCPMCSGAIINSRLDRVVYGAKDDKAGCAGSVADLFVMPFNHTPVIRSGILEGECAAVLSDFFETLRKKPEDFEQN